MNVEVLVVAPGPHFADPILELVLRPRPMLGATVNTEGDTSQVYLGVHGRCRCPIPFSSRAPLAALTMTGRSVGTRQTIVRPTVVGSTFTNREA